MTEKRFTWEYSHYDSTGEIHDWSRNKCLMTDYLQKYELEEWCQELNQIVDENNQLQKENEQLKTQIKIFEKFLNENNLDIDWEIFCTVDECKKDSDDYGCKECKYLGDVK